VRRVLVAVLAGKESLYNNNNNNNNNNNKNNNNNYSNDNHNRVCAAGCGVSVPPLFMWVGECLHTTNSGGEKDFKNNTLRLEVDTSAPAAAKSWSSK
jgi:hypothetical protein